MHRPRGDEAMLIKVKKASDPKPSEIVNEDFYFNRRKFLTGAAALGGTALLPSLSSPAFAAKAKFKNVNKTPWGEGLKPTTFEAVTTYNNFYEFGTGKSDPRCLLMALTRLRSSERCFLPIFILIARKPCSRNPSACFNNCSSVN